MPFGSQCRLSAVRRDWQLVAQLKKHQPMTTAAFPVLGDKSYVSYVGPLSYLGNNPSTHLAEIRYPVQQKPVVSVVKWMSPSGVGICNEALAWLFLRAAGVRQSTHAAILCLTSTRVKLVNPKSSHPKSFFHNGWALGWSSQYLDFQALKVVFAGTEGDRKWAKAMTSLQGAAIAAFDEAFLAADRNAGNLLYISDEDCIPIDHEQLFAMHDWKSGPIPQSNLKSDTMRRLENEHRSRRLSDDRYAEGLNRMVFHAQRHRYALQATQNEITDLILRVFPENGMRYAERVLLFVTERTAARWMENRLGVV